MIEFNIYPFHSSGHLITNNYHNFSTLFFLSLFFRDYLRVKDSKNVYFINLIILYFLNLIIFSLKYSVQLHAST